PYLMEYPYDCAEQTWNRYYANALASHITNASPRLRQVFEKWKTTDTAALLSALQKNEEFKSAILEETPWVLAAKTETEQKRNIAILFDMVRMSTELSSSLEQLKQMQTAGGAFVWFKGGPEDRFITQYIVTGMGRLKKLGVSAENFASVYKPAIAFLDKQITEDYKNLVKSKAKLLTQPSGDIQVQYLYMRSFFPEIPVPASAKTAYTHYRNQAKKFWNQQGKSTQAMTALALSRTADKITPAAILKSLKETSILHEELGRYWKDHQFGISWRWSQAPVETQALMVEAFNEIAKDIRTVDELRTWLIKNKQTNNWRTTKATADACYAMLLQGTNWLDNEPQVQIQLGTTTISNQSGAEAGTGYFKQNIAAEKIQPAMGNVTVTVSGNEIAPTAASWGAVYWQYFEDMNKVTTAATPLQLVKKLFIEKNTDRGPVLAPVTDGMSLEVGDKIVVRIELRVDRDMEYVHMKDLRASSLEPVNVLSGYKWQGGLGYYESTRDASTNFFFNYLRKGAYVFEYSLFVTHTGNFSNGITTIQCMYAPEFSAHSEGVRISVD
ncbi:MAG: alpha-2-macroglobulin family protein, partial [Flavisolibacter sp.]